MLTADDLRLLRKLKRDAEIAQAEAQAKAGAYNAAVLRSLAENDMEPSEWQIDWVKLSCSPIAAQSSKE